MKSVSRPAAIGLIVVILVSCTSAAGPTKSPPLEETAATKHGMQSTPVGIPTDLAFATALVQLLSQSGVGIRSVQSSKYMAMFESTDQAVWIQTDEGIVEAVVFTDPSEARQIHITQQPHETAGRYLYRIQAPPPTLSHDQTIDAAFPLYFTVERGMFMVTSSPELDNTLKSIFTGRGGA